MLFYFSFGTLQLARKFFSNLASVCHVFSHSLKWGKHMRALEAWLHVFSQVKCSSFHFVCFRELWSLLQHEVFFEDLIFKTRATACVKVWPLECHRAETSFHAQHVWTSTASCGCAPVSLLIESSATLEYDFSFASSSYQWFLYEHSIVCF